jgi:hypothetical protein
MLATVLAIGGGLTTAGSLAIIVLLVLGGRDKDADARSAVAAMIVSGKAQVEAERLRRVAEDQRDQAIADATKAHAERDEALKRLASAEKQRNDATDKEADDEAKQVAGAPDVRAAVATLNRESAGELQINVPAAGASGSPAAAGAGDGHAGQDAVQPPSGPATGGAGGRPAG